MKPAKHLLRIMLLSPLAACANHPNGREGFQNIFLRRPQKLLQLPPF